MLDGSLNIKTEEGQRLYKEYVEFCNKLIKFSESEYNLKLSMQMIIHDNKPYKAFTCIIYKDSKEFWVGKDPITPNKAKDYIRLVLDFTENESRKKVKFDPNELHIFVNEGNLKSEKVILFSKVDEITERFLKDINLGALLIEIEKICRKHKIHKKFISEY